MSHSQETESTLPAPMAEIIEEFQAANDQEKLQLLLEFSQELEPLPEHLATSYTDTMEQVPECQSPLYLLVDIDSQSQQVKLLFAAPAEAPTTRGFASILQQGLTGQSPQTILSVPQDLHQRLGLAKAITPLRLRGMAAMLARVQNSIRKELADGASL